MVKKYLLQKLYEESQAENIHHFCTINLPPKSNKLISIRINSRYNKAVYKQYVRLYSR